MDKILTIIIPTYNMEKYLRHCLDSLIVPNMDKVEVLVINDGSKDSSSAIGHEYQDKYPQTFRVIDKENGNYGSCVNRGLKEATGKYVKVLDADDSFDKEGLRTFINILENCNADLVLTDYVIVDEDDKVTSNFSYEEHDPSIPENVNFDFVKFINNEGVNFYGQMHGFAYRTQMLIDMGYHQTEGISYTDQEWVFKPITKVKSCLYNPKSVYRYLVGREGQTMNKLGKSISQLIKVAFSMTEFYSSNTNKVKEYKKYLFSQLTTQIEYIYRLALYERAYPLSILQEFDKALSKNSEVYSLVENAEWDRFPFHIKYIHYWRNHKQKGLPKIFILHKKFKQKVTSLFKA